MLHDISEQSARSLMTDLGLFVSVEIECDGNVRSDVTGAEVETAGARAFQLCPAFPGAGNGAEAFGFIIAGFGPVPCCGHVHFPAQGYPRSEEPFHSDEGYQPEIMGRSPGVTGKVPLGCESRLGWCRGQGRIDASAWILVDFGNGVPVRKFLFLGRKSVEKAAAYDTLDPAVADPVFSCDAEAAPRVVVDIGIDHLFL